MAPDAVDDLVFLSGMVETPRLQVKKDYFPVQMHSKQNRPIAEERLLTVGRRSSAKKKRLNPGPNFLGRSKINLSVA